MLLNTKEKYTMYSDTIISVLKKIENDFQTDYCVTVSTQIIS